MQTTRQQVTLDWDGPMTEVEDVPTEILYNVAVSFKHSAGADAAKVLEKTLAEFGTVSTKRGLLGSKLVVEGNLPLEAKPGKDKVDIRLQQRVKGNRLQKLVDALATIAGARDLKVEAESLKHAPKEVELPKGG